MFAGAGADIIDADRIARRVSGRPEIRKAIRRAFGPGVIGPGGRLNRAELARRVFTDARARSRLNRLIHPAVRREVRRRVAAARKAGRPVVLDVPLLAESPLRGLCDRFMFIHCRRAVRARRVATRGWTPGELGRREGAQLSLKRKRKLADSVMDNDGTLAGLRARVRALLRAWAAEAGGTPARRHAGRNRFIHRRSAK